MNNCGYFKKNMIHYIFNDIEQNEKKLFEEHIKDCSECVKELKNLKILLRKMKIEKELSPSFDSYLNIKKKVYKKPKVNENYIEKLIKWLKKPIPAYGVILLMIVLFGIKSSNQDLNEKGFDYSVFFSDSILTDTIRFITNIDKVLENNDSEVLNLKVLERTFKIFEFKPILKFETATSDKQTYILKMFIKRYRELQEEKKNRDVVCRFLKVDYLT